MVASNVLLCLLGTASGFMLAPPLQTRTTIRAAELSEEQAKEAYYTAVNQFFWKNNMGLLASLAIGGKNEVVTVDQATLDAAFMEINGPAIDAKVADVAKVVGMSATECKTKYVSFFISDRPTFQVVIIPRRDHKKFFWIFFCNFFVLNFCFDFPLLFCVTSL